MLLKSLLTFVFSFIFYLSYAQIIVLKNDKESLVEYAPILLTTSNGIKSQISTNLEGKARIPDRLLKSEYLLLTIKTLGHDEYQDTLYSASLSEEIYILLQTNENWLNQVVVTGQYTPESTDKSIHKVNVIDHERIQNQAAVTLKDVLQNEMNMRISNDALLGSGISLQGLSGQNVKILIDGVPLIGRLNGNIDLSQININDIERIEVVEGPMCVNFGSDALAGTINLITKKTVEKHTEINFNSYVENAGQYNIDASVGKNWNSTNSIILSGGRYLFDGWNPNHAFLELQKERKADTNRFMIWNPRDQVFGKLKYTKQFNGFLIQPYAEAFYETVTNLGRPRAPYFESAFDDYYQTLRSNVGSIANGKLSDHWNLNAVSAFNYFKRTKNTYFNDLTSLEKELTTNSADQDTSVFQLFMARASFSNTRFEKFRYQIGYDLNFETAKGQRILNYTQQQADYAVFGSFEYKPIDRLVVKPAIRLTYNTQYDAPLIPSVNIKYNWNKFTIRTSYARGFRAPSLKELYFEFIDINHNIIGNEHLEAEYSNNFSINILWKTVLEKQLIQFDVSGFYNQVGNLITMAIVDLDNQLYQNINIGEFRTHGLQLNGKLEFESLMVNLGISQIGRFNHLSEEFNLPTYNYSPEFRFNANYRIPVWELNTSLFYKYTGEMPGFSINENDEVVNTMVAEYHMLDVNVSKSFFSNRFNVSLGMKNILGIQNIQSSSASGNSLHSNGSGSVPVGMGRVMFCSLKFKY